MKKIAFLTLAFFLLGCQPIIHYCYRLSEPNISIPCNDGPPLKGWHRAMQFTMDDDGMFGPSITYVMEHDQ